MVGTPRVANFAAIATIITTPVINWTVKTIDVGAYYIYTGSTWNGYAGNPSGIFSRGTTPTNDFALTAGSYVPIPFLVAPQLHGLNWLAGINPTRIIAIIPGIYNIGGYNNTINTTGAGDIVVRVNGSIVTYPSASATTPGGTGTVLITWNFSVVLAANDYVEILARTAGGSFPWIGNNIVFMSLQVFN